MIMINVFRIVIRWAAVCALVAVAACAKTQNQSSGDQIVIKEILIEGEEDGFTQNTKAKVLLRTEGGYLIARLDKPMARDDLPVNASKTMVAMKESADRYRLEEFGWEYMGVVIYGLSADEQKILQPIGRIVIWESAEAKQSFLEKL